MGGGSFGGQTCVEGRHADRGCMECMVLEKDYASTLRSVFGAILLFHAFAIFGKSVGFCVKHLLVMYTVDFLSVLGHYEIIEIYLRLSWVTKPFQAYVTGLLHPTDVTTAPA